MYDFRFHPTSKEINWLLAQAYNKALQDAIDKGEIVQTGEVSFKLMTSATGLTSLKIS